MGENEIEHEAYGRSAFIYDDYIQKADYREGANRLTARILEVNPRARTLLDVGCGTGKYLEHLRDRFECQGLDLSERFLDVARKRCPEMALHQGDMIEFDLGCKFDAISCLFLAIAYVRTVENMERAIASMARHLNPGGILLVEPWVYPRDFWADKLTSEHFEQPDRKISRMYITRVEGNISVYDIHYLVGTAAGVEHFVEREELGLFTHEQYVTAFKNARLRVFHDKEAGLFDAHNIGMYWGIKSPTEASG